jgi:hypothetical protein
LLVVSHGGVMIGMRRMGGPASHILIWDGHQSMVRVEEAVNHLQHGVQSMEMAEEAVSRYGVLSLVRSMQVREIGVDRTVWLRLSCFRGGKETGVRGRLIGVRVQMG